jgi:hypothetical protein
MGKGGDILKTMNNDKLYQHICVKYPHIQYKDNEDLNLNNIYVNMLREMWEDKDRYPSVKVISDKIKISERQIYRLAQSNGLGMRMYKSRK